MYGYERRGEEKRRREEVKALFKIIYNWEHCTIRKIQKVSDVLRLCVTDPDERV